MAKDSSLGKDLIIRYVRKDGTIFTLETEKFNEKPVIDEKKKHPLGEPSEHVQVVPKGWEIDVEGEFVGPDVDDLWYEFEQYYRGKAGATVPEMSVHTEETYSSGDVRKWKFWSDTGLRITNFEKTADKGSEARKWKFKIIAKVRDKVE